MASYYQDILDAIRVEVQPWIGQGKVADYIPALGRIRPDKFGIALVTVDGQEAAAGDADERFSIQSISKVFTLTLAISRADEELWQRCGREPSGNPFNSLVQLEYEKGIPRNPLINAGALVTMDFILSHDDAKEALLDFVRKQSGNAAVDFDEEVAESEKDWGFRNAAMANFLKAQTNLENDVAIVLDAYFHQCSIAMTCRELARSFLYLANQGVNPTTGRQVLSPRQTRRVNSLMLTCGLYDAVGNFAYRVGLPGKSGVGGGIVVVVPRRLALCVWSPPLDPTGNSLAGTQALELFASKSGHSIF
jgi:glutaminase